MASRMFLVSRLRNITILFVASIVQPTMAAESARELDRRFQDEVFPFLQTHCFSCHGKEKPKAKFDLTPYSSMPESNRNI